MHLVKVTRQRHFGFGVGNQCSFFLIFFLFLRLIVAGCPFALALGFSLELIQGSVRSAQFCLPCILTYVLSFRFSVMLQIIGLKQMIWVPMELAIFPGTTLSLAIAQVPVESIPLPLRFSCWQQSKHLLNLATRGTAVESANQRADGWVHSQTLVRPAFWLAKTMKCEREARDTDMDREF